MPLPPTATQREADEALMNGGLASERGRIERKLKSAGAERYLLDFNVRGWLGLGVCVWMGVGVGRWIVYLFTQTPPTPITRPTHTGEGPPDLGGHGAEHADDRHGQVPPLQHGRLPGTDGTGYQCMFVCVVYLLAVPLYT